MTTTALFRQLHDRLAGSGVELSTVFGDEALTLQGKVVAVLLDHSVAFRLGRGTDEEARAFDVPGAAPFDPTRKGRPFRGWVCVPDTATDTWPGFAEDAMSFVGRTVLAGDGGKA